MKGETHANVQGHDANKVTSIWGVADGARLVNVDGEIIAYAILDILAKPVFGFWLLLTHDKMARNSPSIGGFWAHGLSSEGTLRVSREMHIRATESC